MSAEWAEFSRAVFGDPYVVWHEGADYGLLLSRWRDEPVQVGEMLRLGLSAGDPVAAGGIGYLARHGEDTGPLDGPLQEALPNAEGTFRVSVAQALFARSGDQDFAGPVCDVLTGGGHWGARIDAAIALAGFAPASHVISALADGVQDEQYLVRRHSAQALRTLAGLKAPIEKAPAQWAMIRSEDPVTWRLAAGKLTRPWAR